MIGRLLTFPLRHYLLTAAVGGGAYLYYTTAIQREAEVQGTKVMRPI